MKKDIAFISYSSDDKKLSEDISLLLSSARNHLNLNGEIVMDKYIQSEEWRKEILESISNSDWFIPIFTKNSINSPWVNFEVGIAKAKGVKVSPIISRTIRAEQITCCDSQALCLDNDENINIFLAKVFNFKKGSDKSELDNFIAQSPIVQRVKNRFLERWVYIIGSMPNNIEDKEVWINRSEKFISELTKKLLDEKYYITSFPLVKCVGETVVNKVIDEKKIDHYSIAGLYEIDNELKNFSKNMSKNKQKEWDSILTKFRKTYLKDQDFIIVVGGNENTREELYAAKNEHIHFIPIPCLYGTAEDHWSETRNNKKQQCLNHSLCQDYKKCTEDCNKIDEIISLMRAVKY